MSKKLHEECGVFGVYNQERANAVQDTYLALYALQHRGQESAGIAINCNGHFETKRGLGLVPDVFNKKTLQELQTHERPNMSIGHVRYTTEAMASESYAQPLVMRYSRGTIAIAHSGALVNTKKIRQKLEDDGAIFQTNSDAELIGYLISRARLREQTMEQAVMEMSKQITGAYSLVIMSPNKLVAVRDPHGFRPLCIGKRGENYFISSESCALDAIGADFVRDVLPGEIVVFGREGMTSIHMGDIVKSTLCIYEHIYFARSDSVIDGASVHHSRTHAGTLLAQQKKIIGDVVIGVPDSGIDGAIGYANYSGIPYSMGFVKNRYIGRALEGESEKKRKESVSIKLSPIAFAVEGKDVILVDDSIIRGTTSAHIISQLRLAGANKIHMCITSPPFLHPCYFGTNIQASGALIASKNSTDDICKQIGADSLTFLDIERLDNIPEQSQVSFCKSCFTGEYPIHVNIEETEIDDKYSHSI